MPHHTVAPSATHPSPSALDDAALLAMFTPHGTALYERAGGLRQALNLSDTDLEAAGVTAAEIHRLRAVRELGQRYVSSAIKHDEPLTSTTATRRALEARLRDHTHEVFACLFLTSRHVVIHYEEMFHGSIKCAVVHIRQVVKRALEVNAAAIIMAHNHVSGVAEPSDADHEITAKLRDALALVEVRLLDHFVIGNGEMVSFAERGYI